jgi:hypothetical protein
MIFKIKPEKYSSGRQSVAGKRRMHWLLLASVERCGAPSDEEENKSLRRGNAEGFDRTTDPSR